MKINMYSADLVLGDIINILQADADRPEDGYFQNIRERTYRCEAIRQMFCGLRKESQDKVLRLAAKLLVAQNNAFLLPGNDVTSPEPGGGLPKQ